MSVGASLSGLRRFRHNQAGALTFLLVVAGLFGGGGSPSVLSEAVLVGICLAIAGFSILTGGARLLRPNVDRMVLLIALAVPIIALLQSIPLPTGVWRALPERAALAAGLDAVGGQATAWPLSILPSNTIAACLAFIPPLLGFALASQLDADGRRFCLLAIAGLGLASAVAEALQVLGGDSFYLYRRSILAFPSGLFANHNAQGDCLVIALTALTAWSPRSQSGAMKILVLTAALVLVLALIMCGSRTSIALSVIPLALAFVMWRQNRQMTNLAIGRKWLVAAVIAAVLLFLFASDNPLVNQVFARYGKESDPRLTRLWPDSWFALKSSFPFGTGLGTFQQAFEQVERLEILAPGYPNRAHMDFIEFIMETGAAGIVVLGLAAVILFRRIASSRYAPGKFWQDRAAMAAWAIVLVVVMHSLFDYPLRAMTLAVLFGVSCGLLWANKSGIKL